MKKQIITVFSLCFLILLLVLIDFLISRNFDNVNAENSEIVNIEDEKAPLEIAEGEQWNGQLPQNGEVSEADTGSIEIPCYSAIFLKQSETLNLINPKGNDVYFVYTIYDENKKEIYKSKAIKPDNILPVVVDFLDVGEHNLVFEISTFDIKTESPCNGATLDVKLTIKK